ncbi:hypothetical protein [Pseudarthrobacter sp. MDT1-22]
MTELWYSLGSLGQRTCRSHRIALHLGRLEGLARRSEIIGMTDEWKNIFGNFDLGDFDLEPNPEWAKKQRRQRRVVWHYTSAEVFESVIRNDVIWATDVGYLNDTDEIKLGIKKFKKQLRKEGRAKSDVFLSPKEQDAALDLEPVRELLEEWEHYPFQGSAFSVSFSRYGDDNSQWDRYAGQGTGVAIGIRQGSHMPILGDEGSAGSGYGPIEDVPFHWTKMRYERSRQVQAIHSSVGEMLSGMERNPHPDVDVDMSGLIRDQALSEYARGVASIKNRGFRAEHEIRYVISRPSNPDVVHTRPHAKSGLGDVPFLKITGAAEGADLEDDPRWLPQYQETPLTLPIAKVRLGPKHHGSIEETLMTLERGGYRAVPVVKSRSTLR